MNTFSTVILVFLFVIIDLIPQYQNEEWTSFFLSGSLLVIALIMAVLMDLKVEIPTTTEPIKKVVTFIFGSD
ncbi:MAG: hypothetical protein GX796_13180 [Clostridiaceae bacterium]|nr:hypothetical protein [Clostridiaceae bacterium]